MVEREVYINNYVNSKLIYETEKPHIFLTEDKKQILFCKPYRKDDDNYDFELVEERNEDNEVTNGSSWQVIYDYSIEEFKELSNYLLNDVLAPINPNYPFEYFEDAFEYLKGVWGEKFEYKENGNYIWYSPADEEIEKSEKDIIEMANDFLADFEKDYKVRRNVIESLAKKHKRSIKWL